MSSVANLIVALLITASGLTSVAAADPCSELFLRKPFPELKFKIHDKNFGEAEQNKFRQVINGVSDLAKSLKTPKTVYIHASYVADSFFPYTEVPSTIYAAYRYIPHEDSPSGIVAFTAKHRKHSWTALAHEYAHTIFASNFNIGPLQALLYYVGRSHNAQVKRTAGMRALPQTTEFDWHNYTLPYNELFADVVAVLYMRNLSAQADAIDYRGSAPDKHERAQARSFARTHSLKGWQGTIEHTILSPTRTYLGKVFSNPKMIKDRPKLVKAVYDAIEAEIISRARDYDTLTALNHEQMNIRMIDQLQITLTERFGFDPLLP